MTRREEIEQAAMQIGGVHPDWSALECFQMGYKEGAKWADEHPYLSEEEQVGMGGLGMIWQKQLMP